MRTHTATRLLALTLSLRFLARIQTSFNLCDRLQQQNSVAATMIFIFHTRRFVAAMSRRRVAAICRIVCPGGRIPVAKVHFWQTFVAKYLRRQKYMISRGLWSFFNGFRNIDPILNLTASHVSLRIVWQFGLGGIFRGTLIGWSAATHFWVAKIGGNQVGKVLRLVGTRRRTFQKVLSKLS